MRVGRRGKLAFQITVWAVVGVALLAVPALVSTTAHYPSPDTSGNNTGLTSANSITSALTLTGSTKATQSSTPESWTLGDFLVRLSLVLTLAIVLSSLVTVGVRRRFKKSLW